jgi:hypothetical protein
MKRRTFLALVGGGAGYWPFTGRAQQSALRVVGFLRNFKPAELLPPIEFRRALGELGYTEDPCCWNRTTNGPSSAPAT